MGRIFRAAVTILALALASGCVSTQATKADEATQIATAVDIATPAAGKIAGDYRLVFEDTDDLALSTKPLGISLSALTFKGQLGALFQDRARSAGKALFTGVESPTATNVLTLKPTIQDDRLVVLTRGYFRAAARARIATRLMARLDRPGGAIAADIAASETLVEDERESSNVEALPVLLAVADASFQKALTAVIAETASKAKSAQ